MGGELGAGKEREEEEEGRMGGGEGAKRKDSLIPRELDCLPACIGDEGAH